VADNLLGDLTKRVRGIEMKQRTCPKCGREVCIEKVDMGIEILERPSFCPSCGWDRQIEEKEVMMELFREVNKKG